VRNILIHIFISKEFIKWYVTIDYNRKNLNMLIVTEVSEDSEK
jgi:hypothetical protein